MVGSRIECLLTRGLKGLINTVSNTRKFIPPREEASPLPVPGCEEALTRFLALVTFFWGVGQ